MKPTSKKLFKALIISAGIAIVVAIFFPNTFDTFFTAKLNAIMPHGQAESEENEVTEKDALLQDPGPMITAIKTSHQIEPHSNMYLTLREIGVSSEFILSLLNTSKPYFDLSKVPAKFTFEAFWQDLEHKVLSGFNFEISNTRTLKARLLEGEWKADIIEHEITEKLRSYSGVVSNSLWESAENAGMEPILIVNLTEIFAWQVDFNREVRPGDKWRMSVVEQFSKGKSIGWGSILAAEYINQNESYVGIKFPKDDNKTADYFDPDGQSLRRMFLKSPIKFGRVSSRFNRARFHPILKRNRPHLGVDYAAPTGTPVRSVGDGRIEWIGRKGGSGKMIKVRHNSVYQTAYLHLNNYAQGLKKGHKVRQGQVIGYVGSTGLATGPHLHFSFYQNGKYVDPLGKKFPAADPVPPKFLAEYKAYVSEALPLLPNWQLALKEESEGTTHNQL
jgi:murein DD-endopeptidase MepM/ murein hydrolase activator NlpD